MRRPIRRRQLLGLAAVVGLTLLTVYVGNDVLIRFEVSEPSHSAGSPDRGRLRHGKRLPSSGRNFSVYSRLGALLGRTCVHDVIREAVLHAYDDLSIRSPDLRFVYGEASWPGGGRLSPHRTHENGLSADFFVPVRSRSGRPVRVWTHPWNLFGYELEFDNGGRCGDLTIDFEAMAQHLDALDRAAHARGTKIAKLIFAPELLPRLWETPTGRTLKGRFPVVMTPVWVRHDEHYHVDFANPG